jgi:hypothetical protein
VKADVALRRIGFEVRGDFAKLKCHGLPLECERQALPSETRVFKPSFMMLYQPPAIAPAKKESRSSVR